MPRRLAASASALEHPPAFGTHLGILFCDVDHFKDINDTWGHGIGDAVLITLAARIRESVRQGDTVGRTGGDEILVVLPGLHSIDEVAHIGEKIRCRATEAIHESGNTIHATLSIGATIAVPGEPVSSITARADAAMYQAKLSDRNTVILIEPTQRSRAYCSVIRSSLAVVRHDEMDLHGPRGSSGTRRRAASASWSPLIYLRSGHRGRFCLEKHRQ